MTSPRRRRFAPLTERQLVLVLLLSSVAIGCASGPSSSASFGQGLPRVAPGAGIEAQEREMFERLNADRRAEGLAQLAYDPALAEVARYHSADMRDNRFFAHESPTSGSLEQRLDAAGYLFAKATENLSEAPDVQRGQDGLLQSPGHRANIMDPEVTHVGIGIVRGGVESPQNLTITQVFARPGRAEAPGQAEEAMLRHIQTARGGRGLAPAARHPVLDELARRYVQELDDETSQGSLKEVGQRITAEVSARRDTGLQSVLVGAQLLSDSDGFQLPAPLLEAPQAPFGLALRRVRSPAGRPLLQVLLLVGQ